MKKINFNDNWVCYQKGAEENAVSVTLPHDAMQWDHKNPSAPSGVHNGWYEARDYIYRKTFFVSEEDLGKELWLEFEGVYHKASVFLNGERIAYHSYGYTGFYVNLGKTLHYGEDNLLEVQAANSAQPNCRWYTGTGIYRPVWLYKLPPRHILLDGVRITPMDYVVPRVQIEVKTNTAGNIAVEILDSEGNVLAEEKGEAAKTENKGQARFCRMLNIPDGKLWSPESPFLYVCKVIFEEDSRVELFGIRVVTCDVDKGFCINGQRVILKGSCIHHDNGLLGACAYDFAEERKVRLLKDNGYNALRSAHNPCSKALLRACDKLGMLVLDEYVDVWYIHKTQYDYAGEVESNYKEDLKDMVTKDYNHPSVVLYSTGNEVSETAQKRGIALCRAMTDHLHVLDPSRPVTCGVNIFFNFLSSMGFGVYSDKKAEKETSGSQKKKAVGSEFFNKLAGFLGADFMKLGATLPPCDWKTKDSYAAMDVAGYNYGIARYRHDLKKYPKRMILGTETFCSDAARFIQIVEKEKRVIGDFVWAGMDYLGEVGVGSWEYKDYAKDFYGGIGWVSAGSGRIDLTGKPLAEMAYTRVVFGLEPIGVAVVPVGSAGKPHSPSAWKMSNAVESWSWNGQEGAPALVEVYSRADHVALFLNGSQVAFKKGNKNCRTTFRISYQSGELKAVAYDYCNRVLGEKILRTAGEETILLLEPEQDTVSAENGLCYVRLKYTDRAGTVKPLVRGDIQVTVENGRLLGLGSACPYYPRGYFGNATDTYYGEALAIVKPDGRKTVFIQASSSFGNAKAEIKVI